MSHTPRPGTRAPAQAWFSAGTDTTRFLARLLPGLAVVALCTLSAAFLADHYGTPLTLLALLIGLSLSFLNTDERLRPGLSLASGFFLRIGIVLIGTRVTLAKIASIGFDSLALVAVIVAVTIGSAIVVARALGMSRGFGALAGGAVAICGASAALAFATVLGDRRVAKSDLTLVLVGISVFSAVAMIVYPLLARHLGFSDIQAGFMLGASIHDVAQSISAGFAFSPGAGETAAVVKLSRVALLAPAMLAFATFFPKDDGMKGRQFVLPWFVLGFFIVVGVNSAGWIPPVIADASSQVTAALLAAAVSAAAIQSPTREIVNAGWRPLFVIVAASLVALLLSTLAAWLSL